MHSSATKTDLVPRDDAKSSGSDPQDRAAAQVDPAPNSNEQEPFSPDEYQRTDRYRLVRPYQATPDRDRPGS